MIDIKAAVLFVMKQEDSTLSGIVTNDPTDHGGTTRFGLTLKFHPELVAQEFFNAIAVPAERALSMAELAYEQQYTAPLHLAEFKSQAICTALLSFSVVEGNVQAVRLLQRALNECALSVVEDGELGPATIGAANALPPAQLLQAWILCEDQFFSQLVEHTPSQQRFLQGWENRAAALKELL